MVFSPAQQKRERTFEGFNRGVAEKFSREFAGCITIAQLLERYYATNSLENFKGKVNRKLI